MTIDTFYSNLWLTAQFYIDGYLIGTSAPFEIHNDVRHDKQHFSVNMPQHLTADYYNLEVKIIDAHYTYAYQNINYQSWSSLGQLPLESAANDYFIGDEHDEGNYDGHHAGNLSLLLILLLAVLLLKNVREPNRRYNRNI